MALWHRVCEYEDRGDDRSKGAVEGSQVGGEWDESTSDTHLTYPDIDGRLSDIRARVVCMKEGCIMT